LRSSATASPCRRRGSRSHRCGAGCPRQRTVSLVCLLAVFIRLFLGGASGRLPFGDGAAVEPGPGCRGLRRTGLRRLIRRGVLGIGLGPLPRLGGAAGGILGTATGRVLCALRGVLCALRGVLGALGGILGQCVRRLLARGALAVSALAFGDGASGLLALLLPARRRRRFGRLRGGRRLG